MQNSITPPSGKARVKRGWRLIGLGLISIAALITLIALFYLEEDLRGAHDWSKYRRDAEARGVVLDWQKLVPPEVADDENFAMTPFLAPLFDLNTRPYNGSPFRDTNGVNRAQKFGDDFLRAVTAVEAKQTPDLVATAANIQKVSKSQAPAISDRTEAARYLLTQMGQFDSVLDEIRTASKRPNARFNVHYDDEDPAAILLPHLAVLKRISQILQVKASAELVLGRTDSAFDDTRLMLYLADSIRTEPILISQLVRAAILNLAREIIWEGLAQHQWSDAQLKEFQSSLAKIALLQEGRWTADTERTFFGVRLFDYFRKDPANLRNIFYSEPGKPDAPIILLSYGPKGWLYQEEISYQKFFDDAVLPGYSSEGTQVYPHFFDANAAKLEKIQEGPVSKLLFHRVLVGEIASAYGKSAQKFAFGQTGVDQANIACGLERYRLAHGKLPDTLAALVPQYLDHVPLDVCDGKPMRYQLQEGGEFLLYSVGWDEKDDGGEATSSSELKKSQTVNLTGDWVWPHSTIRTEITF